MNDNEKDCITAEAPINIKRSIVRKRIHETIQENGRYFINRIKSQPLKMLAEEIMLMNEEYVLNHYSANATEDTESIMTIGFTNKQSEIIEKLKVKLGS